MDTLYHKVLVYSKNFVNYFSMFRSFRTRMAKSSLLPLFTVITLVTFACGSLLLGRMLFTRSIHYLFLPFNLILATIPILFSVMFSSAETRKGRVIHGFLWLLFFPNAPYIVTDFVHLTRIGGANGSPLWFDILLVTSYAGAGLIFGYISLLQVQRSIAENHPVAGWMVTVCSCFLAGFGIYLGRFLRWHSVDIFLNPISLASDVADRFLNPLAHPRAWGVTLGFGMLVLSGYLAVVFLGRLESRARSRTLTEPSAIE